MHHLYIHTCQYDLIYIKVSGANSAIYTLLSEQSIRCSNSMCLWLGTLFIPESSNAAYSSWVNVQYDYLHPGIYSELMLFLPVGENGICYLHPGCVGNEANYTQMSITNTAIYTCLWTCQKVILH